MNKPLQAEIFRLLSDTSQVTNKEMQSAYECFMEQIETTSQSETDFTEAFRMLNLTRIEFKALQKQILCEQGKKCPENSISSKGNLVS